MNTVPKLIETDDLDSAVIIRADNTVFTRTGEIDAFPFISNTSNGCFNIDSINQHISVMKSEDVVAYRIDDPNYIPPIPIPIGTALYNVYFEDDDLAVESWTPALHFEPYGLGRSWVNLLTDKSVDLDDVVSFCYGKNSPTFNVRNDGAISGIFKGHHGPTVFKNINELISRINSGEFDR